MKKNDYFVIVCRVLAYLYECLKEGEDPSLEYLQNGTDAFPANKRYWTYILFNMQDSGLIRGVSVVRSLGQPVDVKILPTIEITPTGIEYLQNNSALSKAKNFLKTLKEVVPGL